MAGEAAIHYHYDGEGRLIAETDAVSGETIRDYVWLGLTPIASFGPANDNNPPSEPENCDEQEIATLQAMLTSAQDELSLLQSDLADHEDTRVFRLERIAQMEAELETLTGKKREKLADKIAGWTEKVDKLDGKITDAATAITGLEAMILQLETDIAAAQAVCDGSSGTGGGSGGTGTQSGVTFLHSDHLGRPKFATNADGEVIWDEGITTPFGIQITAMAAQTQALMFPGQYQDLETTGAGVTLSHNWHRTYDPMLGRYLQSDPIGLAGGLNRYAYVGGNPLGYVDFTGLAWQKNGAGYWEQDNKPLSEYNMVEKAQYAHFNRNIFNNAPCFLDDAKGFEELLAADFHQQGIGGEQNRKYINGLSEGIYDANGRRVNDPLNRGTYNYSKPYTPILNPKNFGHLVYDVVPYWLWKNDPDDPTSFVQRLGGTYNGPIPQGGSCECLTNIPALRGSYR